MESVKETRPGTLLWRVPVQIVFLNEPNFRILEYEGIKYRYIQFDKSFRIPYYHTVLGKKEFDLPFRFEVQKDENLEDRKYYIMSVFIDSTEFLSLSLTPINPQPTNYRLFIGSFGWRANDKKPGFNSIMALSSEKPRALFLKVQTSKSGNHREKDIIVISKDLEIYEYGTTVKRNYYVYSIFPNFELLLKTKNKEEREMKLEELKKGKVEIKLW